MKMDLSVAFVRKLFVDGCSSAVGGLREEALQGLDRIDHLTDPVSYDDFFAKYLLPNVPCVLGKWSTAEWSSRTEWSTADGKLSWESLENLFGDTMAPVSNCSKQQHYSQAKTDMKVKDFITHVRKAEGIDEGESNDVLYLKDWHFTREFPQCKAYETPPYFASDWLNEFWDSRNHGDCSDADDYRFVYIGPKGSWTPFHADVFRSYSWSANICGRKKWILFAPGYEQQLVDKFGQLPFDLRLVNFDISTAEICFEVIQESGEIIFVPSGWHHQVFNIEDTASINHNWFNGCNVDICWNYLKQRLKEVEEEISEHCQMEDWNKHCQLILRADSGMDFIDFFNLLSLIASNRMKQIHKHLSNCKQHHWSKENSVTLQNSSTELIQSEYKHRSSVCDIDELDARAHHLELDISDNVTGLDESSLHEEMGNDTGSRKCRFDIGFGLVLFDLLQIKYLLESEFLSADLHKLGDNRFVRTPDDLISKISDITHQCLSARCRID